MLDRAKAELYGPWAPMWPSDAAALLDGYSGTWWIGGGYAIDAATGTQRAHGDIDLIIPRGELGLLRGWIGSSYHVWCAFGGALKPLHPSDSSVLPAGCNQIWLRRDAYSPWEFDVILDPSDPDSDTWQYRRDVSITMPLSEALFTERGIRYLRPSLALLYMSAMPDGQRHLEAALPTLDAADRAWLHTNLPAGHAWAEILGDPSGD